MIDLFEMSENPINAKYLVIIKEGIGLDEKSWNKGNTEEIRGRAVKAYTGGKWIAECFELKVG